MHNRTIFHECARHGIWEVLDYVEDLFPGSPPDVNLINSEGETALNCAIRKRNAGKRSIDHLWLVEKFLHLGADPFFNDWKYDTKRNALKTLIEEFRREPLDLEILSMFLKELESSSDKQDVLKHILMFFIEQLQNGIIYETAITMCLQHGADPNVQLRGSKQTLLIVIVRKCASRGDRRRTLTSLLNSVLGYVFSGDLDLDMQDSQSKSALHYAVSCQDEEIVEKLVTMGADPNLTTDGNISPLQMARNMFDDVEALLNRNGPRTEHIVKDVTRRIVEILEAAEPKLLSSKVPNKETCVISTRFPATSGSCGRGLRFL